MVYLDCLSPELIQHNTGDTQNNSTFVKQQQLISKLEKKIIKRPKKYHP